MHFRVTWPTYKDSAQMLDNLNGQISNGRVTKTAAPNEQEVEGIKSRWTNDQTSDKLS